MAGHITSVSRDHQGYDDQPILGAVGERSILLLASPPGLVSLVANRNLDSPRVLCHRQYSITSPPAS